MDDETALLYLGAGDASDESAAKAALADRYHARLMTVLERQFKQDPEVAGHAATEALIRLFAKARKSPGRIDAKDSGVWRWLLKVAGNAAVDFHRWTRRHRFASFDPHDELDGDSGPAGGPEPYKVALGREEGRRVLAFILALQDPERGILLNDLYGGYAELDDDAREDHDVKLIECSKALGIWTRDALRSARTRARTKLRTFIERGTR